MPALYGLIGFPLNHSFSPAYFRKKFADLNIDAAYEAFPLESISEFPSLLNAYPDLKGLNVTLPYKETVISYLDELDPVAAEIGAVNCINLKNGKKKGFNTDAAGFERSLIPLLESQHTHALILGTGGSSKAVAYVLQQMGISYQRVSREKKAGCITYNDLTVEMMNEHRLIVNTTSLGLYPDMDHAAPIPYDCLGPQHLLYDLIYNPEESKFLTLGKERGAAIKNGFEMLQLQAEASWDIWTINAQIPE